MQLSFHLRSSIYYLECAVEIDVVNNDRLYLKCFGSISYHYGIDDLHTVHCSLKLTVMVMRYAGHSLDMKMHLRSKTMGRSMFQDN